ncbi:hypothetical protein [Geoalkalibacter halelectricus]|uniref:DUF2802 domain-containing protein n=1 Tax=Geoalkalibacter halelectricus TaxID=2847045 RepID=A0ABY5ZKL8_9BACT|nr:hypothetical protein [Geoalkalibacter halelectricus]MDO3378056.1 hypothetical protein [Geoalkalibacter halelectricus]UWZ78355.1 hypothetical protein L9S41_11710 [Geoalkalibacter halelectricus]
MDLQYVNFFAVAVLATVVGVTLIVVHLSQRKLRAELFALREELALWQKVVAAPRAEAAPLAVDAEPANQAQQAPTAAPTPVDEEQIRARLQQAGCGGEAPERYRHVATLADKGLAPEEIARVLQVSAMEAEQLVRLAEVGRKKS